MDTKELLETLSAQQDYIKQLEQGKEELQQDFDSVAISLIGFAKDFGVEDIIKGSAGATTSKIITKVGVKLMSGKISFNKLEALAPLITKYHSRYEDQF